MIGLLMVMRLTSDLWQVHVIVYMLKQGYSHKVSPLTLDKQCMTTLNELVD